MAEPRRGTVVNTDRSPPMDELDLGSRALSSTKEQDQHVAREALAIEAGNWSLLRDSEWRSPVITKKPRSGRDCATQIRVVSCGASATCPALRDGWRAGLAGTTVWLRRNRAPEKKSKKDNEWGFPAWMVAAQWMWKERCVGDIPGWQGNTTGDDAAEGLRDPGGAPLRSHHRCPLPCSASSNKEKLLLLTGWPGEGDSSWPAAMATLPSSQEQQTGPSVFIYQCSHPLQPASCITLFFSWLFFRCCFSRPS